MSCQMLALVLNNSSGVTFDLLLMLLPTLIEVTHTNGY